MVELLKTDPKLLKTDPSNKMVKAFRLAIAMLVAVVLTTMAIPATEAEAASATKNQTVSLTIHMGKYGCDCPELTFVKVVKKGQTAQKVIVQAVSKWQIDGKTTKDPWSKFYAPGWKFNKHKVTVVMKAKLAPGTYKAYVDNGTSTKHVATIKVGNKAVSKPVSFAKLKGKSALVVTWS